MKLIWWLWIALTLALIALATDRMHGDTIKQIPNSIGTPQFFTNQWSYLLGLPIDGEILDGQYTNIRFQPYGTPELFDQSVLFCGDMAQAFDNKLGPLVIVYRTQASRTYKGIACHELKAVFEVPTK